jgi:GTP-binding protein HflX
MSGPAILFGYKISTKQGEKGRYYRNELKSLCYTLGLNIVCEIEQVTKHSNKLNLTPYKKNELTIACQEHNTDTIVYDGFIHISQLVAFEQETELHLIDRTALILQIFANNAMSKEAKLQVELAQLQYLLPRLKGKGVALSRLGGGIGTRGPGEKKLEHDRRIARERIHKLKQEIAKIHGVNQGRIDKRHQSSVPSVVLVGYTNSGKSTLFNAMTSESSKAEDLLFATVDTLHRKMTLPNNKLVMLIDTVGFISNLPHQLVDSFKATLAEAKVADLVLIVIDYSHDFWRDQLSTVNRILDELEIREEDCLFVFNKVDLLGDIKCGPVLPDELGQIYLSAKFGTNFEQLRNTILSKLQNRTKRV